MPGTTLPYPSPRLSSPRRRDAALGRTHRDKILTYSLSNGNPRWQAAFRATCMVGTPDGKAVLVASETEVIAIDNNGAKLWETPLPTALGAKTIDQITVGDSEAYVTAKSTNDTSGSRDVDVIALSMG